MTRLTYYRPKECHERWIRYLKPGVRKGQWQDHEDAIVVEAVTSSKEQPFFCWFASYDAHRGWDADRQWHADKYGPMHRAKDVVVPPFLIDDQQTREDLASYYNEVTRFDYRIGVVVDEGVVKS